MPRESVRFYFKTSVRFCHEYYYFLISVERIDCRVIVGPFSCSKSVGVSLVDAVLAVAVLNETCSAFLIINICFCFRSQIVTIDDDIVVMVVMGGTTGHH